MNEQLARDVVLVRAIETADAKHEVLSDDDRLYATRSARELAQWQAADSKAAVTDEHFLQQRSELLIKRLVERHPALGPVLSKRHGIGGLALAMPLLALLLGAGLDRIGDPHRVDLLSAPLLAIIVWNLVVYVLMLVWALVPGKTVGWIGEGWMRALGGSVTKLPRKLPLVLSSALTEFLREWAGLSARLNRARLSRTVHLSAAAFAVGAMLSLYARGFLTEYRAGWESTFLDASQVHAILSVLFAPAQALFQIEGFSIADIEALRFSNPPTAAGGARWVYLYGATLALVVIVPRLVLSAFAHVRARALKRDFPLDLGQPYFRKLGGQSASAGPAVLRVLPYSFTLDEARDHGLAQLALSLFGEHGRVMLRPASQYGDEPAAVLRDLGVNDASVAVTAVLFNLAATPEKENHGVFLDYLVQHSPRGIAALVDESAFAERSDAERIAQRVALWTEFCRFHGVPATIVNLLHPERRAPADDAGLRLSKAP